VPKEIVVSSGLASMSGRGSRGLPRPRTKQAGERGIIGVCRNPGSADRRTNVHADVPPTLVEHLAWQQRRAQAWMDQSGHLKGETVRALRGQPRLDAARVAALSKLDDKFVVQATTTTP